MNWQRTFLATVALLFLATPSITLAGKPDQGSCPCVNWWAWYLWPADCTHDLNLLVRGGWPSQSNKPSPISEVQWSGFSEYYDFSAEYGVKESEDVFVCYFWGYGETLPDPTEIYAESDPLSLDEARGCVFATRDVFEIILSEYDMCQ